MRTPSSVSCRTLTGTGRKISTITFRAWDRTGSFANGAAGVNASATGGTNPFSTASETASIAVTAVNDAPVLNNSGSPYLTTYNEDDTATRAL